jgi:hypothetical protein
MTFFTIFVAIIFITQIPVAERFKARVYGHSLAGIEGSNPAGAWMSVSLVSIVYCQVEVSATDRSLVQRSPTDCGVSMCVISEPRALGGSGPRWAVAPETKKKILQQYRSREIDRNYLNA